MANISSTDLFHFVREEQYLQEIIKNKGFWPYYCVEYCWAKRHWAIPMVCFCDIPLSRIKNHIKKYGGKGYGIGMSKKWAVDNEVSPVLYASYKSPLYKKIYQFSRNLKPSKSEKDLSVAEQILYRIKRVTASKTEQKYIKNGSKKRKFYNEREWRYIPQVTDKIHMELWDPSENSSESAFRAKLSERTREQRLSFNANDVKYIIVPDGDSRESMLDFLNSLDMPIKDIDLLKTKIMTVKDIYDDF